MCGQTLLERRRRSSRARIELAEEQRQVEVRAVPLRYEEPIEWRLRLTREHRTRIPAPAAAQRLFSPVRPIDHRVTRKQRAHVAPIDPGTHHFLRRETRDRPRAVFQDDDRVLLGEIGFEALARHLVVVAGEDVEHRVALAGVEIVRRHDGGGQPSVTLRSGCGSRAHCPSPALACRGASRGGAWPGFANRPDRFRRA